MEIFTFFFNFFISGLYSNYSAAIVPLGFQEPASIAFSNMIDFHNYMFVLLFVVLLTLTLLFFYNARNFQKCKDKIHGDLSYLMTAMFLITLLNVHFFLFLLVGQKLSLVLTVWLALLFIFSPQLNNFVVKTYKIPIAKRIPNFSGMRFFSFAILTVVFSWFVAWLFFFIHNVFILLFIFFLIFTIFTALWFGYLKNNSKNYFFCLTALVIFCLVFCTIRTMVFLGFSCLTSSTSFMFSSVLLISLVSYITIFGLCLFIFPTLCLKLVLFFYLNIVEGSIWKKFFFFVSVSLSICVRCLVFLVFTGICVQTDYLSVVTSIILFAAPLKFFISDLLNPHIEFIKEHFDTLFPSEDKAYLMFDNCMGKENGDRKAKPSLMEVLCRPIKPLCMLSTTNMFTKLSTCMLGPILANRPRTMATAYFKAPVPVGKEFEHLFHVSDADLQKAKNSGNPNALISMRAFTHSKTILVPDFTNPTRLKTFQTESISNVDIDGKSNDQYLSCREIQIALCDFDHFMVPSKIGDQYEDNNQYFVDRARTAYKFRTNVPPSTTLINSNGKLIKK